MNLKKLLDKRYTTEDVECIYSQCIGHLCTALSELRFARNTLPISAQWRNEDLCEVLHDAIIVLLKPMKARTMTRRVTNDDTDD